MEKIKYKPKLEVIIKIDGNETFYYRGRLMRSFRKSLIQDGWRVAEGLEIDLFYNGVVVITDLSKL